MCSTRSAISSEKGWRMYQFITQHFLASLMPSLRYTESIATILAGGIAFRHAYNVVADMAWAAVLPWRVRHLQFDAGAKVGQHGPAGEEDAGKGKGGEQQSGKGVGREKGRGDLG